MTTPFTVLTAVAAPLPQAHVDTDTIIRVEPLFGGVAREDLGPYALAALRYRADGSEDPDFVLNRAPYRGAGILVTGPNFGCGSSREGAVWALLAAGIRCVIASSFGDIFYANCFQNGLLPLQLPPAEVAALLQVITHAAGSTLKVDLHACTLEGVGFARIDFRLPARRREGLLKGLDDLELTLAKSAQIDAFQARDAVARPWIHLAAGARSLDGVHPATSDPESP